ncbi:MAG: oligosaccharyl transferase, archaeosortase A system-associated [Dehalococcoidia bacterium]|nr:MAG: oligosaccharyl transferase, archaeosortase A system-associated [Dehalococcoidia bacterium]
MNRFGIKIGSSIHATYGLALAFIFGIAFFIRVYFPYDNVFAGDWVRFQINDPWYHMRVIENLVQHFPNRMPFDPYGFYPSGQEVATAPFFDWLAGFFIWVLGAGSPSKGLIETLGAYFPVILGALVTIPVFFIGKELFNRKAGLLAAFLIAILPGFFLQRSLLGFTDHHVAETMFSTLTALFLILAVKSSKQKGISFSTVWSRDWRTLRKPLIYSLLTGISLGLYLLSWTGGALFIFIIFVFAVLQYIMDHLRGRSTDYLCVIGVPSFLIALLMIAPASGQYSLGSLQVSSLLIGIAAFVALSGLSFLMVRRNIRAAYYPLALAVLVGIGYGLFYLIDPSLLNSMLDKVGVLSPTGGQATIAEAGGLSSTSEIWQHFTTGFYLSIASLAIIAYLTIREGDANKTLLIVWSVIMLIATFGQARFSYYLAVNVSLLTAYFCWRSLEFAGFREASEEVKREEFDQRARLQTERWKPKQSKKAKRRKEKPQRREQVSFTTRYLNAKNAYGLIALILVFFLAFFPNILVATDWAKAPSGATPEWHAALVWLKGNTTDPFGDDDFYYQRYGESYDYPEPEYGVMSWWDYGYWITYIAHRIPNANPNGQRGAPDAGLFFTAQDEASANEVLDRLGSKYVIVDYPMATGKFYAMVEWAGKDQDDFFEWYAQRTSTGGFEPIMLYYREYYQSMCSRLYNFGGKEWIPKETTAVSEGVIVPIEVRDMEGNRFTLKAKAISDVQSFTNYDDAKAFVDANPSYKIVGTDRFTSPVPLEELEDYELVYPTPLTGEEDRIYPVEVFEYRP